MENFELFHIVHLELFQEDQQGRGRKRLVFVIHSIFIFNVMDKCNKPPEMFGGADSPPSRI
jgi:hypothetical protein